MSDLISRRALCQYALNQKDKSVTPNDIMRFPSADRPTGKWVDHKYDGNGYDPKRRYECPNCGIPLGETEFDSIKYNFCPVCGADLREGRK